MQMTEDDIGIYLDQLLKNNQIKLEITGGTRTWRLLPSPRHQKLIDRVRATIEPIPDSDRSYGCGYYHLADVQLKFPDGSFKRPDIAIFCTEPPDIDESWEQVPEAVIEVISPNYEEKDLSINPPWYLAQGVRDVLIVDPRTEQITHWRHATAVITHTMPYDVDLLCGCRVTI
ncbi:MAG: Uma2 family endonuclease [Chloroflexota bacterium]